MVESTYVPIIFHVAVPVDASEADTVVRQVALKLLSETVAVGRLPAGGDGRAKRQYPQVISGRDLGTREDDAWCCAGNHQRQGRREERE